MSQLLKSLSPEKDAVLVSIAATSLIQELWESRVWVNPRVFLKSAQATLACLALQGLNEEDSTQTVEMQWAWDNSSLKSLYADSLFQGAVRTEYSWVGAEGEELPELRGNFQIRRKVGLFETSGIVESTGDVVLDVQESLLLSEQKDCALAVSVRWNVDETSDIAQLKIVRAHAYLLHVLPPMIDSTREGNLLGWQKFLNILGSPAEWELSTDPTLAVEEMTNLVFASPRGMKIFSKNLMFFCSCTEEKILRILKTLSPDDLKTLPDIIEVSCKYCGKIYPAVNSKD